MDSFGSEEGSRVDVVFPPLPESIWGVVANQVQQQAAGALGVSGFRSVPLVA